MTYFVDQNGCVVVVSNPNSTKSVNHARRTALNASQGADKKIR